MTTAMKHRSPKAIGAAKTGRKAAAKKSPNLPKAKKPLRIREELLPASAVYGTFAGREYVMIPVEDFGDWYEDTVDMAVAEDRGDDPGPGVPAEQVFAHLPHPKRRLSRYLPNP